MCKQCSLNVFLLVLFASHVATLQATTTTIALYTFEGSGVISGSVGGIGSNPVNLNVFGDPRYDTDVAPLSMTGSSSVSLDGAGDYLQSAAGDVPTTAVDNIGIEAWCKANSFGSFSFVANLGFGGGQPRGFGLIEQGGKWRLLYNGVGYPAISTSASVTGQWVHLAVVIDGSIARLFVNGVEEVTNAVAGTPGAISNVTDHMTIGGNPWDVPNGVFDGLIDHVRIFTFNPGEFDVSDLTFDFLQATNPNPGDGADNIDVSGVVLSWTAGETAISHDVYYGTDQTAVMNATTASPEFQGNITATTYDPGSLDFDTIYFWRIDEVESTNPSVVHTGEVWSFATRSPIDITDLNADFNGDCRVDIADLKFFASEFLEVVSPANLIGVIDGGLDLVGLDDYAVLVANYGEICITLEDLLQEMIDRDRLARFPALEYESLQASSYDRSSVAPDQPGWFSNGDCCGFIRTEQINGQTEWVIMEHDGPGVLTRLWTPFFYRSFSNHGGPNIRIYLDGSTTPVIDENFIELLTRGDYPVAPPISNSFTVQEPFANFTARAGTLFLPIPFGQSCKITTTTSPFYNIINYRAYPSGTSVKSFTMDDYNAASALLGNVGNTLQTASNFTGGTELTLNEAIAPGGEATLVLPAGSAAIRHFQITLNPHADATTLRSTILQMTFDGEQTVWCPVGDFFCSPDSVHPFQTYNRTVTAGGEMTCRWVMPYQSNGEIKILNLGSGSVTADLVVRTDSWNWDDRSMHFRTNWRRDNNPNPGNNVFDWNFIEVFGQGVHISDSWTVVYPGTIWWGEGDEKVWVDDDFTENFPSHIGTGTEDYYGWAGGEPPHGDTDEFSNPFHSNVKVGMLTNPRGYNISLRSRLLDATPFKTRFKLDIEAWSLEGGSTELVAYSSGVTQWYALPGATHNRPPLPAEAQAPIFTVEILDALEAELKGTPFMISGAIEFESQPVSSQTGGLTTSTEGIPVVFSQSQWSNQAQRLVETTQVGDFVEFTFGSQFSSKDITVYLAQMSDYGIVRISVNGDVVGDYDTYSAIPLIMEPISLGTHSPVGNAFVVRFEIVGQNEKSDGIHLGLDALLIQ